MVRKPNKTMIGLFLMIGGAVFALILGTYLKRVFWADNSNVVVMYFQESIRVPKALKAVRWNQCVRSARMLSAAVIRFCFF